MGGRGSGGKPIPREVKELRGTLRPDSRRQRRMEVHRGPLRCPAGTPTAVATIFRRLVRLLDSAGILRPIDTDLLLQLAMAIHIRDTAFRELLSSGGAYQDKTHGGRQAKSPHFQIWRDACAEVRSLSPHFGLSPADRERVHAPTEKPLSIAEMLTALATDEPEAVFVPPLNRKQRHEKPI